MSRPQDRRVGTITAGPSLRWALSLVVGTLLIRCVTVAAFFSNLRDDPDAYRHIASNLVSEGTFGTNRPEQVHAVPTAYRPPLYPLLLAAICADNTAIPSSHIA